MRVVISGFDPYTGVEENPSRIVVQTLAQQGIAVDSPEDDVLGGEDVSVHAVVLPVSFDEAWPKLRENLEAIRPDVVVATGLKSAARGILLERCAINLVDAEPSSPTGQATGSDCSAGAAAARRSAGDTGRAGKAKKTIDPDGPAAFWTRLPLRSIREDFGRDEIASALSSDAGTFICNSLFYSLMKWTSAQRHVLSGFVSLPVITQSAHSQHGLTVAQQVTACRDVVRQTVRYSLDSASEGLLTA